MAYKVIILYQLYMPSYFLGTFTEYPSDIFKIIFILCPQFLGIHAIHLFFGISFGNRNIFLSL